MTLRGTQPVILNGQRLYVVTETNAKPRYIPRWLWKWMVKKVVQSQRVTTSLDHQKQETR